MFRTACAAAFLLVPGPAAARPDDVASEQPPAAQIIEIPVDDARAEAIQMVVAAAIGAGCAVGALRRRPRRGAGSVAADAVPAVIDLTARHPGPDGVPRSSGLTP